MADTLAELVVDSVAALTMAMGPRRCSTAPTPATRTAAGCSG